MASFIFELAQALGHAVTARIRNNLHEGGLARGEILAIATILEILSQPSDRHAGGSTSHCDQSWEALERMAEDDLELVSHARQRSAPTRPQSAMS
jgi:hypothetical protein